MMPEPSFFLYQQALQRILQGTLVAPGAATLSAHLMTPAFAPDQIAHETLADIRADELSSADYSACPLTGIQVTTSNGAASLTSDPVIFGNPVTVPPFRYLVIAYGAATAAAHKKQLLLCLDLVPADGALEAINDVLEISPPPNGWVTIAPTQ